MPGRRRHRTVVRLTGIRLREQGTHDSFCAYYAAAMLLCTLRPEIDDDFDAVHVKNDPLFKHLPRGRRSLDRAVAEWLTSGVRFFPLARALDAACGGGTRFRAKRLAFDYATLDMLRSSVDVGLPCVLGWESRELGNHTVLVVGYDRGAHPKAHRWLRVLDPTRGQDIIEWGQLARVTSAPADVIWCTAHDGTRPDRLTVVRDAAGKQMRSSIERWNVAKTKWEAIVTRPKK